MVKALKDHKIIRSYTDGGQLVRDVIEIKEGEEVDLDNLKPEYVNVLLREQAIPKPKKSKKSKQQEV